MTTQLACALDMDLDHECPEYPDGLHMCTADDTDHTNPHTCACGHTWPTKATP
ncbi:hypothetical protein SEA_GRAVAILLIA_78 [Mycobacterium phage Gravaillia]|uniref:Uncharacterized protein n=1 Tax=Mycobacterium phage Gancho TaxID=2301613 RepID=A0A385UET6_9CAUD|nr:hypothetical protein SEA_GANCHO_84 [Mycobacterium phage Gancho]WAB10187.1 hypothetical protein SEA_GRAVAILLIA_78 [Mycobacterium phage Gravaillia]